MTPMRPDYAKLTYVELALRCAAAEDVCVVVGRAGRAGDTVVDKAIERLWEQWLAIAGRAAMDPSKTPHLAPRELVRLAVELDEDRALQRAVRERRQGRPAESDAEPLETSGVHPTTDRG